MDAPRFATSHPYRVYPRLQGIWKCHTPSLYVSLQAQSPTTGMRFGSTSPRTRSTAADVFRHDGFAIPLTMSRAATRWAYGPEINESALSAPDRVVLRALSWKMNPAKGRTKPLSDDDLTRLTGYTARQTFTNARKRLSALGLLAFEHGNKVKDRETHEKVSTKTTYVYCVKFKKKDRWS